MVDSNTAQPCKGLSWTYDAWGNRTDQSVTSGGKNNVPPGAWRLHGRDVLHQERLGGRIVACAGTRPAAGLPGPGACPTTTRRSVWAARGRAGNGTCGFRASLLAR